MPNQTYNNGTDSTPSQQRCNCFMRLLELAWVVILVRFVITSSPIYNYHPPTFLISSVLLLCYGMGKCGSYRNDDQDSASTSPILPRPRQTNDVARQHGHNDQQSMSNREKRKKHLLQNMIIKTIVSDDHPDKADDQVHLRDVLRAKFKEGTKELETCTCHSCTIVTQQTSATDESDDHSAASAIEDLTPGSTNEINESDQCRPNQFVSLSPQLAQLVRMKPVNETSTSTNNACTKTCSVCQHRDSTSGDNLAQNQMHNQRRLSNRSIASSNSLMQSFQSQTASGIMSSIRSLLTSNPVLGHHNHSDRSLSCPICLEDFQVGDDVVWSTNTDCVHIHHKECIMHWLQDHDDCPLCRNDFVPPV